MNIVMTILFNHGMIHPYPVKWVEHRLCKLKETHRLQDVKYENSTSLFES